MNTASFGRLLGKEFMCPGPSVAMAIKAMTYCITHEPLDGLIENCHTCCVGHQI